MSRGGMNDGAAVSLRLLLHYPDVQEMSSKIASTCFRKQEQISLVELSLSVLGY